MSIRTINIRRQPSAAAYAPSLNTIRYELTLVGHRVVTQCVAWTSVAAPVGHVFNHGETVLIGDRRFTFGSVVGYAMENGEDPVEAVERATRLGHEMRWLSSNASGIYSGSVIEHEVMYALSFGDVVRFEGGNYRVDRAPNANAKLVRVD